MNKNELVSAIADKSGLSKVNAKKALEAFEEAVSESLANGDSVTLVGFGTFSVTKREARNGVNPATGAAIQIAAKNVAKFKAGAKLAEVVN